MAAPSLANPAATASTSVASSLQVTLKDGSTRAFKLAYQTFFITGDLVPDGNGGKVLAGAYVDIFNRPIIDKSVPGKERQFFSDCPDGTSLLKLDHPKVTGIKGKAVFAVVQFEYTNADQSGADAYGALPSPIAVLTLDQDQSTGALTLVSNLANPDKVSNPDNLKFSEKLRTLFISEDSSTHLNNFVWAYNVDTKQLSRLMSMPSGAEATGLGEIDDLNGWMYITSNFQHPGDWLPKLHGKVQATLDPLVRANYKDRFGAAVGYLTGDLAGIKLG
jgi:hypothetical protein